MGLFTTQSGNILIKLVTWTWELWQR